ncbi:MAG: hypothetical protein HQL75_02765 [Magnetococcales bacterium]|nr:hypothetical protein [Magnetococcales bacterium]
MNTGSEWRWLAYGDDHPWYPGKRLFRQKIPKGRASMVADAVYFRW